MDISADILPDISLGGFKLRSSLGDIQEELEELYRQSMVVFQHYRLFEVTYRLSAGAISIAVDIRNGKIHRLSAGQGYQGTLFEAIKVGMPVGTALGIEPRLYYDDAEEMVFCRGVPGVSIEVPNTIAYAGKALTDLPIDSISVFVRELDTLSGQSGYW